MDALILAGGENRRFPTQKAFAEVRGRRSIDVIAGLLRRSFRTIFLSTNSPEEFFHLGFPMIGDVLDVRGPMNGIYSALAATGVPELFVVACDAPLIESRLVELLRERYHGQDAVIPVHEGRLQPLPGIYSARGLARMKENAASGKQGLRDLLYGLDVCVVSEDDVRSADPGGLTFMSINTPEDYLKICGLAGREAAHAAA